MRFLDLPVIAGSFFAGHARLLPQTVAQAAEAARSLWEHPPSPRVTGK
ncbi:MAG: hypothetical protein VX529_11260 [Pseudomonadota bacterium]|jgi:hypothetical protein|nr:hypothetical protein [Pseudomonadota bacterium]